MVPMMAVKQSKTTEARAPVVQKTCLSWVHWYDSGSRCNCKCTAAIQQHNTYVTQENSNKIQSQKKAFSTFPPHY